MGVYATLLKVCISIAEFVAQVGVYATLDKWSSGEVFKLDTIFDVMFNLGFLLIIIGGIGNAIQIRIQSGFVFSSFVDPDPYSV